MKYKGKVKVKCQINEDLVIDLTLWSGNYNFKPNKDDVLLSFKEFFNGFEVEIEEIPEKHSPNNKIQQP